MQNALHRNMPSTHCLIQHWATNPSRHDALLFLSLPHLILLPADALLQPNPKFCFNSDCGLLGCERGHRMTLPVLPWRLPGYQLATKCHKPETHNLSIHCCRNLKSYMTFLSCHLRGNDTVSSRHCSHQYVHSYQHGFLSFFNTKIWLKLIHSWAPYTGGPICSMAGTKVELPSPTVTKNYYDIPNQLTMHIINYQYATKFFFRR